MTQLDALLELTVNTPSVVVPAYGLASNPTITPRHAVGNDVVKVNVAVDMELTEMVPHWK